MERKPKTSADLAKQPIVLTDEQAEALEVMAAPTYTIDQIVDGLRLEWVAYEDEWSARAMHADYRVWKTSVGFRHVWHSGTPMPCDSIEAGKTACLADYRQRFRAELERVVGVREIHRRHLRQDKNRHGD